MRTSRRGSRSAPPSERGAQVQTRVMSVVRAHISTSLDGYVAGPNQSQEEPLGEGGEHLHDWLVALKAWREAQGMTGGEENISNTIVAEENTNVGAEIMG